MEDCNCCWHAAVLCAIVGMLLQVYGCRCAYKYNAVHDATPVFKTMLQVADAKAPAVLASCNLMGWGLKMT